MKTFTVDQQTLVDATYKTASWFFEVSNAYIDYDAQTGKFTVGNSIVGATSLATATIEKIQRLTQTTGRLHLSGILGTFEDDEIIYEASYGSELVTNGALTDWSDDDPDSWHVNNEDGANYVTEVSGKAQFVSDNSANLFMQQSLLTADKFFYYSIDVTTATSGSLKLLGSDVIDTLDTAKTYTGVFKATTVYLGVARTAACNIIIDNISCKKITNAALVNGTLNTSLGTVTGSFRDVTTLPVGLLARTAGVKITGSIDAAVEIFGIDIEV